MNPVEGLLWGKLQRLLKMVPMDNGADIPPTDAPPAVGLPQSIPWVATVSTTPLQP
jgi:hypothetical protein